MADCSSSASRLTKPQPEAPAAALQSSLPDLGAGPQRAGKIRSFDETAPAETIPSYGTLRSRRAPLPDTDHCYLFISGLGPSGARQFAFLRGQCLFYSDCGGGIRRFGIGGL